MAQMVDLIEKQRWSPTFNLAHSINISKVSKGQSSSQHTVPVPGLCWELGSTFTGWTSATKSNKPSRVTPLPPGNTLALQFTTTCMLDTHGKLCFSSVTSNLDEPTVNPAGGLPLHPKLEGEHRHCSQKGHFFTWRMLTSDSLVKLWNTGKKKKKKRKGFYLAIQ